MAQLSFNEAKRLAIKKWKMHVRDGGESHRVKTDDELSVLHHYCGFCERWKDAYYGTDCEHCEFAIEGDNCTKQGSLYDSWLETRDKEHAQAILSVLENMGEEDDY